MQNTPSSRAVSRTASRMQHPAFMGTLANEDDADLVWEAVGYLFEFAAVLRQVEGLSASPN